MNALFKWHGKWHLMNQEAAPAGGTGWSHLISADLVRWRRLPTVLGPTGWDGSLSIVNGVPTILFDCQSAGGCHDLSSTPAAGAFDRPVIGVARPANSSDELLVDWKRDAANPIAVAGTMKPYAGPSNLWQTASGTWRMVMITGGATGLYESSDPTLHAWRLLNASFYRRRGGGGGLFHRLPPAAATSTAPQPYTHFLQTDAPGKNDGTNWFILGHYQDDRTDLQPLSPSAVPLDVSTHLVYSTIGLDGFTSPSGVPSRMPSLTQSLMPSRVLHIGWVLGGAVNTLSSVRAVKYDQAQALLTALPAEEYTELRGRVLGAWRDMGLDLSCTSRPLRHLAAGYPYASAVPLCLYFCV